MAGRGEAGSGGGAAELGWRHGRCIMHEGEACAHTESGPRIGFLYRVAHGREWRTLVMNLAGAVYADGGV